MTGLFFIISLNGITSSSEKIVWNKALRIEATAGITIQSVSIWNNWNGDREQEPNPLCTANGIWE